MAYEIQDETLVQRYPLAQLRAFCDAFLRRLGASADEATLISAGLMTASQWWHPGQGQGLEKLFRYQRRVANGGILPNAPMRFVVDGPAYALLDAAKGFGYVAAQRAMQRALEKARASGIAMVGVRHSNHFGIAGYHALTAARQGFIGWALTNAAAEMAPWGSAQVVLGTNPWGIAIPRSQSQAIVLDMALTMSGKGMMRWYAREGREMPPDWALTPAGQPTTDPEAAMAGPLLPIGAYKGYGLSLFSDVLAGVMTGALFGRQVFQDDQNFDVGHMLIAIDPAALLPAADFERRLEELVAQVKGAAPIDEARPVLLPGEVEFGRMRERQARGIPVAQAEAREFREHHIETVQQAMRLGVRVTAGTDAGGWFHGNNSVELDMLVDAGMTPMQAIAAGTREAAACCGLERDLGTLEAGKLADLIVVDGNPLNDITVLQERERIRLVMKEGVAYRDLLSRPESRNG